MKKLLSYFNRVLCALVLCACLVSFGSPVSSHSEVVSGATGESVENSLCGVTLTVSCRKITESEVEFYGKAVAVKNYTADSFGIVYSTERNFNDSDASFLSIDEIYGTSFSVSENSLVPGTTYYYASYIKKGSLYKYSAVKSFTTRRLSAPIVSAISQITGVSALISADVVLPLGQPSSLEYGFEYSLDEKFSYGVTKKKTTDIYSDNKFRIKIVSLTPKTTYFYRAYIKVNGVYSYSDVKSFTTVHLSTPVLYSASQITKSSAFISSKVVPPLGGPSLECGFEYSQSEDLSYGVITKEINNLDYHNKFSTFIGSLIPETTYYYRSYIKTKGIYSYSAVKSFTTSLHPYKIESDLNMSAASDLSSRASANCYIVSNDGLYKFKTVKGNSFESVGDVASAAIIWESFGTSESPEYLDLIKAFCYKDGYIAFFIADTFKEGNAVIAAKDKDGNILWSWHIWLTDQPQGQVYYNRVGTMMDRNLGATSATPGDVGALGLLYQWGRKDPFLATSSISSTSIANSTITWPSAMLSDSSIGTIEYTIAHPTTCISYNKYNLDWNYTGSSLIDNTRWTTSESTKSIYDPCPAGWRVPDGGVWSKALGLNSNCIQNECWHREEATYDRINKGMNFSGKFGSASIIWYPIATFPDHYGASRYPDVGRYWSASTCDKFVYYLYFSSCGAVCPAHYNAPAYARSVRCIKE